MGFHAVAFMGLLLVFDDAFKILRRRRPGLYPLLLTVIGFAAVAVLLGALLGTISFGTFLTHLTITASLACFLAAVLGLGRAAEVLRENHPRSSTFIVIAMLLIMQG